MIMKQIILISLLVIFAFGADKLCRNKYNGPFPNTYLAGCINDCQDFPTLEAAQAACTSIPECGGITFAAKGFPNSQGAIDLILGWQLRKSSKPLASQDNERSYVKTDVINCQECWTQYIGNFRDTSLSGCDQDCKDFENLYDAQRACAKSETCGGLTWAKQEEGGSASTGPVNGYGYQLRASKVLDKSNGIIGSWVKGNKVCDPVSFTYEGPFNQQYLSKCANHCKDYPTLEEAKIACDQDQTCQGITWSDKTLGGQLSQGFYNGRGYQLRKSGNPVASVQQSGEQSWTKKICAQLFSECNYQGDVINICQDQVAHVNIPEGFSVLSVKVPPGFSVQLFNKKDLEGKRMTIIGNTACLESGYSFA